VDSSLKAQGFARYLFAPGYGLGAHRPVSPQPCFAQSLSSRAIRQATLDSAIEASCGSVLAEGGLTWWKGFSSVKEAKADELKAPGGTMADQSPEEIHLKHMRAPDYKEIAADGTLHKIVDNHLVITFYIEDSRVTGEVLKRDGQNPPTYRIAAIEEETQRLDLVAVRVPTKAILGLAAAVAERLTQQAAEKTPKSAKK